MSTTESRIGKGEDFKCNLAKLGPFGEEDKNLRSGGNVKEMTVVIGQRGGGQILGVFDDKRMIKNLKAKVKKYHQEGYVVFEKLKMNEPRLKRFGLYFK